MRPINRGIAPQEYTQYRDAGRDLQDRLGSYCSYCERQIETHLAVEHIQPKAHVSELHNVWSNFLLSCVNCNSCKGDSYINPPDYLWPDIDNTMRAVIYTEGGLVQAEPGLSAPIRAKAQATIELIGLDRDPGNPCENRQPSTADRRWQRRFQVWQLAEETKQWLESNNSPEVRALIVETALGRGMYSIWWTVFAGDTDMRRRFREAFRGTDNACFDTSENLLQRVGGQV